MSTPVLRRKRPLFQLPQFWRRETDFDSTAGGYASLRPGQGGLGCDFCWRLVYRIPGASVPDPAALDWQSLPSGCVLHMHWHRTPALARTLEDEGFRVVSVARHPLDLLLSKSCNSACTTTRPFSGLAARTATRGRYGAPYQTAPAFIRYASGPRAAALMAVNREWWPAPGALQVRYEELTADAPRELRRIEATLEKHHSPAPAAGGCAAGATIPRLRKKIGVAHHFWQGRPDLWKHLLAAPAAERIALAHSLYSSELRYACNP